MKKWEYIKVFSNINNCHFPDKKRKKKRKKKRTAIKLWRL